MITIKNEILRKQPNFWNNFLFHPTDAVEDPWGRRILDRVAADGAIDTIRIYTMFEDIVYMDENGKLQYDFRLSDLRLDYLVEKGYNILLAYGGIPDCISSNTHVSTSVSKNKTRYKGKMWNTSPVSDIALWEELCFEYTNHIVERYGIEEVSAWYCQCFNEPDGPPFFMSEYPSGTVDNQYNVLRCTEYCRMYEAFEKAVRRVSERIKIGGPSLAHRLPFLEQFLAYVKDNHLKMDYIALHNYGTAPAMMNDGTRKISVQNNIIKHQGYVDLIRKYGFDDVEVVVDEWGAAACGFFNREEAPELMYRETEVFSSYFTKLIHECIHADFEISKLMICLSGQHEMVEDFTGFRNFFTLNFIAKPIYNSYILASKLNDNLLAVEHDTDNLFVIPTKNENGEYAVMLTYASEHFEEDLPEMEKTLTFAEDTSGKKVSIWCIDKNTTNPYRLYQKLGIETPDAEDLKVLREEGRIKPIQEYVATGKEEITLTLTSNATYLVEVKNQ